jgi:speckle-type POZ protein
MVTEGFNYLEETCPSLLSDLLATVAVVDDDPASSVNRKRGVSINEDANPVETVEASDRRTRRRV